MRQVLILALCVAAALAVTVPKNCSAIPAPSATANYYMPPKTCVDKDPAVLSCITGFSTCLSVATDCSGINTCFQLRVACLISVKPVDTECNAWETGLENAGLYLEAGGSYKDSTLERACEFGLCAVAKEAFDNDKLKAADGTVCPVDFTVACALPNFAPPTRSPTQAEYAVTFGGAAWAEVLKNAPVGSEKYRKLEDAVSKGLATLLNVLQHYIVITEMKVGSLLVKFIVNAPNVNIADVTAKLEEAKANPAIAKAAFADLETESGVTIEVTGVATELPTPVPVPGQNNTTPEPTPASAGLVSVAAAVVAVIAMMI